MNARPSFIETQKLRDTSNIPRNRRQKAKKNVAAEKKPQAPKNAIVINKPQANLQSSVQVQDKRFPLLNFNQDLDQQIILASNCQVKKSLRLTSKYFSNLIRLIKNTDLPLSSLHPAKDHLLILIHAGIRKLTPS